MIPEDYDAVVQLWQSAGLEYLPHGRDQYERIVTELTREENAFLVGELGETVVASIFATHDGRKGWINRLAVHPDHQHHGFAQRLIQAAEKALETQGIEIIGALIEADNDRSRALFEQAGYQARPHIQYFSKRKYPWT
ncbi:MAG: GNAT family N-acetyltransferase [Candidatus Marinimicrobia bacterium]|nr:GNAT family N-acetyltransferase [Candidatus Neomarinimicrobiota bacterium]MCF7839804.1 GNAT family N-acetyltransferase [Candidatus Neomarinimicrobiota bacterium]MCF7901838.1 GNAT family N-acetyltransferase [Candidatus Neomarinimicrobiota bacterium]